MGSLFEPRHPAPFPSLPSYHHSLPKQPSRLSPVLIFTLLPSTPTPTKPHKHVWTRKGRREATPQDLARQHPGYHQACHPPSRAPRRCQAYLWPHLRGDPGGAQDLPRERHPRLGHLHRARKAQDRHLPRRRLRSEATGPNSLRFRRISESGWILPSRPSRLLLCPGLSLAHPVSLVRCPSRQSPSPFFFS